MTVNRVVAAAFTFSLAAFSAGMTHAQTPTPMGFWQFAAGVVLAPYGDEAPKWLVIVGPTLSYKPEYEGSAHAELQPGALINIRYRNRLFLSTGEGLGYDVFRGHNFRAGVAVAYDLGRNDDLNGLRGLGGVDPAPQFKLYGDYVVRPRIGEREFPLILSLVVAKAVGGYQGTNGIASLYLPIAGSKEKKYAVFVGGTTEISGEKTMQTYFGVTPAQSAASGLPVYNPSMGVRAAGAGMNSIWFFKPHWMLNTSVGVKWLLSSAEGSPVVQKQFQFTTNVGLAYRF